MAPSLDERKHYLHILLDQVNKKHQNRMQRQRDDDELQQRHFQSWDTFWGRPGYGAPREGKGTQKENLMKMLHYPAQKVI